VERGENLIVEVVYTGRRVGRKLPGTQFADVAGKAIELRSMASPYDFAQGRLGGCPHASISASPLSRAFSAWFPIK